MLATNLTSVNAPGKKRFGEGEEKPGDDTRRQDFAREIRVTTVDQTVRKARVAFRLQASRFSSCERTAKADACPQFFARSFTDSATVRSFLEASSATPRAKRITG